MKFSLGKPEPLKTYKLMTSVMKTSQEPPAFLSYRKLRFHTPASEILIYDVIQGENKIC